MGHKASDKRTGRRYNWSNLPIWRVYEKIVGPRFRRRDASRPLRLWIQRDAGKEEAVFAAWGDVEAAYQRRADLVPNLVEVVKGYAKHENETLVAVTEARAKVGSVQVTRKC